MRINKHLLVMSYFAMLNKVKKSGSGSGNRLFSK